MNQDLYEEIEKYLKTGEIPKRLTSRFQIYRFKKHFSEDNGFSIKTGELTKDNKKIIPESELQEILNDIYNNPLLSRNGLHSFYKKVSELYYGISFEQCRKFLQNSETYQLHKQNVEGYVTKPLIKSTPRSYLQADTIDLSNLSHPNNGYGYVMTVIDVFSKYAWAIPIKSVSSKETARALQSILDSYPNISDLHTIHTDNGVEFQKDFQELVKKYNISLVHGRSHNPNSQAHIERFNRTIKGMIFQYLTKYKTNLYVPVLPISIKNYNESYHNTIKAKPSEIFSSNQKDLIERTHKNIVDSVSGKLNLQARSEPKISPGDKVRILLRAIDPNYRKQIGKLTKKYIQQWTKDIYTIKSKYRDKSGYLVVKILEKPEYRLYIHEVQKINPGELVKSEVNKSDLIRYGINIGGFGRAK